LFLAEFFKTGRSLCPQVVHKIHKIMKLQNHKIIQYKALYSLFHFCVHRWFAVDATAVTAFGVCSAVHTRKQAA
jgi:hypothetical protein